MVKINRLEIENVKRVQAVQIEPSPSGLTVIGGKNDQGKTSVLDAILWAIGGNKFRPSQPKREGSSADPRIRIEMDNGLVVIREGKNASLKVIDAYGRKAGQTLLDELIGQLALNLPAFMHGSAKDKAETLLQAIGVGEQLATFDREADRLYNERHLLGQTLTRKKKHAEDLPFEQGVPEQEVSVSELIQQQQAILARNGENQRLRARRDELAVTVRRIDAELQLLRDRLRETEERLAAAQDEFVIASKSVAELVDESTAELEASLRRIDDTNRRVRINAEKRRAEADAADLEAQVEELTTQLEEVRDNRKKLLDSADLPLPDLSVENGELTYRGQQWDCMSGSDQLRVAVAIARKLKPECHFVLLDKTEQMDLDTLREFGAWLEAEGLQVIATRVSTGGECSIIIEDGLVAGAAPVVTTVTAPSPFDQEGF